jgi:phenylalanyl-tRNA synthetase beta chain
VECPELCPRFTARVFEGVSLGPSPLWLRARLLACGMRPINNVVDISNYAMLLSGQPLHAFDLDRVSGGQLTVRRARGGERIQTLDGQTRLLDEEIVLIEDSEGPTSIAGIMGGERSEVSEGTSRVLLEVATWNGANIQRSALRLGLRSEASSRFEKGLSPGQTLEAQAVAGALLVEVCGARVLDGTIDIGGPPPEPPPILLHPERVQALLGKEIPSERCSEILSSLGFTVSGGGEALQVSVPHFRRGDVSREVDLIEEVARIDGLDLLPATLPPRRGAVGRLTHPQRVRRRAEDILAGRGLSEVVGWSFTDPGLLERLRIPEGHWLRRVVRIENPLSEAQSMMRPTLLGSLLDAARHNVSHGRPDVAIFESGTVYRASREGPLADEPHVLGALLTGARSPRDWRSPPAEAGGRAADFFAAKGLLAAVLDALHVDWSVEPSPWPFLHPGRSANVLCADGGQTLGLLGELHPLVAEAWDLEGAAVFVVDLGKVSEASPPVIRYRAFPGFPPVRQDLAVILPEEVPSAEVLSAVREAAGELLDDVRVFDVYVGPQVGEGRRSLALSLSLRAPDRTLSEEEVGPVRRRIVASLGRLGGELRA